MISTGRIVEVILFILPEQITFCAVVGPDQLQNPIMGLSVIALVNTFSVRVGFSKSSSCNWLIDLIGKYATSDLH